MSIKPVGLVGAMLLASSLTWADLAATLNQAITIDPALKQSEALEQGFYYQADAARGWADPTLALKTMGIPFSFKVSEQPMAQLQLSVSQMLPNFEAQSLKASELIQTGQLEPIKRDLRQRQLTLQVSQLWLDALKWQYTLNQLEQFGPEIDRLQNLAELSFRQGLMQAGSNNILAAEALALKLQLRQVQAQTMLDNALLAFGKFGIVISTAPDVANTHSSWPLSAVSTSANFTANQHPQVQLLAAQQQIKQTQSEFALSQDNMRFGMSASYSYRFDDPMGNNRADLFSLGASVSLPVFSNDTANAKHLAALSAQEALLQQQALLERQLTSQWQTLQAAVRNTEQALSVNTQQAEQQSQLLDNAIAAYTNNDGQFKPMIDAQLALFELELAALDMHHRLQNHYAQQQFLIGAAQ